MCNDVSVSNMMHPQEPGQPSGCAEQVHGVSGVLPEHAAAGAAPQQGARAEGTLLPLLLIFVLFLTGARGQKLACLKQVLLALWVALVEHLYQAACLAMAGALKHEMLKSSQIFNRIRPS